MPNEPRSAPVSAEDLRSQHHKIQMRDGVHLATDVYLPSEPLGQVPTVLIRLPYDKSGRYTFIPQIGEYFAAHGLACVAQDVRGKYRSEGERNPFVNEARDGWDTMDWIVAQPWSNGAVGTWGDSYYGFTQWALASVKHPAHLAMVPRVTGHRFGDLRPGGGMPTFTLLDWVVDAWATSELILSGGVDHNVLPTASSVHPSLPNGQRLFRKFIDVAKNPNNFADELFPEGNPAENLQIPALHTGGWFDNLQYWQLDDWLAASTHSPAAGHQYLRMWSNDHEDYRWREPGVALAGDFGESSDALSEHLPELLDEPISFFHHYLSRTHGRWPAPTVKYDHIRVGSRVAAEWPPKRVASTRFWLGQESLALSQVGDDEFSEWLHDPKNPVPSPIPSEWSQNRSGLPDESHLHSRADVATFTSQDFDSAIDIVGRITFEGCVTAPTERTHVIARLCDVSADGSARIIAANACDTIADGATIFRLRLGDTAYRLPAGHRLRLAISTSLSGQYVIHPGTDGDPWNSITGSAATQRLNLHRSSLCLFTDQSEGPAALNQK